MKGCYLLHFEPRYKHAGHYLGYADNILNRVSDHRAGTSGVRLTSAAARAGCQMMLVRVWRRKGRKYERELKGLRNEKRTGSLARICPACLALRQLELDRLTGIPAAINDVPSASMALRRGRV